MMGVLGECTALRGGAGGIMTAPYVAVDVGADVADDAYAYIMYNRIHTRVRGG